MTDVQSSYHAFPQGVFSVALALLISKNNEDEQKSNEAQVAYTPETSGDTYSFTKTLVNCDPDYSLTERNNMSMYNFLAPTEYYYLLPTSLTQISNYKDENLETDHSTEYKDESFDFHCNSHMRDYYNDNISLYQQQFFNLLQLEDEEIVDEPPQEFDTVTVASEKVDNSEIDSSIKKEEPAIETNECNQQSILQEKPVGNRLREIPALFDVRYKSIVQEHHSSSPPPLVQTIRSFNEMFNSAPTFLSNIPTFKTSNPLTVRSKSADVSTSSSSSDEISSYDIKSNNSTSPVFFDGSNLRKKSMTKEEEDLLKLIEKSGDDVAQMKTQEFMQIIRHLPSEQMRKLKDLRRRYKNKLAARFCRAKRALLYENMKNKLHHLQNVYADHFNILSTLVSMKESKKSGSQQI